jgi:hypothetical protein
LALGGCRAFQEHRLGLERLHSAGMLERADRELADPRVQDLYEPRSRTLLELERGALALLLGRPEDALRHLEEAERRIDLWREASASDVVAQWVLSDAATTYLPGPYEDLYVNVLKMLAQYALGRIEGGVTVEARRMARKANLLRDRYMELSRELDRRGGPTLVEAMRHRPGARPDEGVFVESTLGIYLSALAFMQTGESEFQRVAERRLFEALEAMGGLSGGVEPARFRGLGELPRGRYNVLVVALSGRAPTRTVERVGPIPILSLPVYLELPRLVTHPSLVKGARVWVEGGSEALELDLIEDLSAVAEENHRRQLPQIYARTVLRYILKASGTMVATEAVARRQSREDRDLVRVLGGLAGLGLLMATERADLRCWSFLPGQARVGLLSLEEGRHRITVEFTGLGGTIERREMEVEARSGQLRAVVVAAAAGR